MSNYSSASFNPNHYLGRQHSGTMKNSYLNETRGLADYMRGDFNPIVDSLDFMPNVSSYENLSGDGFSTWSTDDMKPRIDFRSQNLGTNDTCARLPCSANDYRNLPAPISTHQYRVHGRRPGSVTRNQEVGHFDMPVSHRDQLAPCLPNFESNPYATDDERAYDPKLLFGDACNLSMTTGVTMARVNGDLAPVGPPLHSHAVAQGMPATTHTVTPSTTEGPHSGAIMMTPDSSTIGFLTNKLLASSDDGEISPTPTSGSGQPRAANRTRKAAPTLATGRRNLKSEPVDADEADRRMKRRERNRKSAQKCRERKVQRTQELQSQVECLQSEINRLTQERDSLRNEARQFITLLQIHCPGVATPYMSCLNELSERKSCCSSVSVKPDLLLDNMPNGWKMRLNGKADPHVELLSQPSHTTFFSRLSMSASVSSRMSPTRSKPSFSFPSSDPIESITEVTAPTTVLSHSNADTVVSRSVAISLGRCTSVASNQGPASASSSSCSGYDLAFPAVDPSLSSSLLNSHLEDTAETVASRSAILRDTDSVVLSSPNRTPSHIQAPASKAVSDSAPSLHLKCEDWVEANPHPPAHYTIPGASGGSQTDCVISPLVSSSAETGAANQARVSLVEAQSRSSRVMDSTCFL